MACPTRNAIASRRRTIRSKKSGKQPDFADLDDPLAEMRRRAR
jgi:hypothetical protein